MRNENELLEKLGQAVRVMSELSAILIREKKEMENRSPGVLILLPSPKTLDGSGEGLSDSKELLVPGPDESS